MGLKIIIGIPILFLILLKLLLVLLKMNTNGTKTNMDIFLNNLYNFFRYNISGVNL